MILSRCRLPGRRSAGGSAAVPYLQFGFPRGGEALFTVIICDRAVIKDCTEKYKIHLKPLLENDSYTFCEWNPYGETLEEAVPELNKAINIRREWRAVILADNRIGVLDNSLTNPFDYVGYQAFNKETDMDSAEKVAAYRTYVDESAQKAMQNPLMRLSMWLSGSVGKLRPFEPPEDIMHGEPYSQKYLEAVQKEDYSTLDLEKMRARVIRFDRLSEKFSLDSELFNPPSQVIAIAERSKNIELIEEEVAWAHHYNFDYSGFAEDNMYAGKLRFVTYELKRIRNKIKEYDYFVFLTTLLLFSQNEVQSDYIKPGMVYAMKTEVDDKRVSSLCNQYLKKLVKTLNKISGLHRRREMESRRRLDDIEAEREFEAEVSVPVTIDRQFSKETLMCSHDKIGLAKDCPEDEQGYWYRQHKEIRKHFTRFLRQPQRSVEKAVEGDFRKNDAIDSERAKLLSKYQRQDVVYKLLDEEQEMLEIDTPKIFNKARYDEELDDANKSILRGISQRMTRRKTIITGLLPLLLYLIGFVPLIISEYNNLGTGMFSVLLTAGALAVLLAVIVIMMLLFRKRIVDRFKHFNYVMSGIYEDIMSGIEKFSVYLSSACNVKREFAVIDAIDNDAFDYHKIYKKHEIDIERNMGDIMTLFNDFVEEGFSEDIEDVEPYPFDFDKPINYPYDMPYSDVGVTIDFLKPGNTVTAPIDFVTEITIRREELYD